ncbi:MAG: F0F1 ATP synthase subunit B [Clostridiales bacterium]|nr:F0F1 ATP synthase subunit B [Clostridiales bacterium]
MLRLDWNLVFTIINIVILYALMKKFLFKPVEKIIQKRRDLINEQIAEAETAKEQALNLKTQYETALGNADQEGVEIVKKARIKALSEHERILEEAEEKAKKIVVDVQNKAESDRIKILREAELQITQLAVAAASKIIHEQSNAETDQTVYNEFLKKAGESSGDNPK